MAEVHSNIVYVQEIWSKFASGNLEQFFEAIAPDGAWLGWTTVGVPACMTKDEFVGEVRAMAAKVDSASSELFDLETVGDELVMGKCRARRVSGEHSVDTVFPIIFRLNEGKIQYGADLQPKSMAEFWEAASRDRSG